MDLGGNQPSWFEGSRYRIKPDKTNLQQYGAKEGDVWLVNSERHLFTGVVQGVGIDCLCLADDTMGAFDWDWDKFNKEGVLLYRTGVVNKL